MKPENILLTGFSSPTFNPFNASVKIADWASGTPLHLLLLSMSFLLIKLVASPPSNYMITPPSFRSPESWLELPWNTKTDIWSFGAIVSLSQTASSLYPFQTNIFQIGSLMTGPYGELYGSSKEDENEAGIEMLQKQNSMIGEYPQHMIEAASEDTVTLFKYFNGIKQAMKEAGKQYWEWRWIMRELSIPEEDGAFVERVLKMDPEERLSAEELLKDKWFEGI